MFFKTSIIHPFLFAVFPIIHLYSINFFEVSIDEIILPILVSVLVTCVFLILSKLILKDWVKSGLIVSLLIILVFFYGHIYNLLNTGILADAEIGRHRYLMIMSLVVFIIGTVLIIKTQIKLDNLNIIINVIAITLIIIFRLSNLICVLMISTVPIMNTTRDIIMRYLCLPISASANIPVFNKL